MYQASPPLSPLNLLCCCLPLTIFLTKVEVFNMAERVFPVLCRW